AMISASINTQRNKNQILTSHSVTEAPNNRHIGEVPAPQLSKARVLLAEDDVINQQVAIGMLNKINIKPDTAINGLEVLEKTQTNDYDLILMDCLMPKMDGFEATRLLRDNIKTRDVPVVALTANAQKVDRERCIECGMNDFLSKPFEFNDLENMLSRWLPESITDTDSPDQETTPENSMLMDFDIYEKLKSTIPDAFDNIINTFLHETTLRIEEIIDHVEQNQFDAIILLAHSLKSSSAIVGAISLSNCAISMESAAKEHNKEAAAALAIELKEIFNDLQQTIDSYRATST
ncbi:MAG: response regulator, partial [Gammaproteobacteria bacterium]|nr:response regulator [Gammaproteobacteria bacterium]